MDVLSRVQQEVLALLQDVVGPEIALVRDQLTQPPNPEMGDIAFGCFPLAKTWKKSPDGVADDLAQPGEHLCREPSDRLRRLDGRRLAVGRLARAAPALSSVNVIDAERAVALRYQAATVAADSLKDAGQAIEICRTVLARQPAHSASIALLSPGRAMRGSGGERESDPLMGGVKGVGGVGVGGWRGAGSD